MLSARVRSRPSLKLEVISASTAGEAIAPPAPCTARAASSHAAEVARPPASEAAVNSTIPAMKTRRRPRMSPARPPSSSRPPNVSVYALSTQDKLGAEKCSPRAMLGKAMFTTVMSRMIMSWAPSTRASAMPLVSGCRAGPGRRSEAIRVGDNVDIAAFLSGCLKGPQAAAFAGRGQIRRAAPAARRCTAQLPAAAERSERHVRRAQRRRRVAGGDRAAGGRRDRHVVPPLSEPAGTAGGCLPRSGGRAQRQGEAAERIRGSWRGTGRVAAGACQLRPHEAQPVLGPTGHARQGLGVPLGLQPRDTRVGRHAALPGTAGRGGAGRRRREGSAQAGARDQHGSGAGTGRRRAGRPAARLHPGWAASATAAKRLALWPSLQQRARVAGGAGRPLRGLSSVNGPGFPPEASRRSGSTTSPAMSRGSAKKNSRLRSLPRSVESLGRSRSGVTSSMTTRPPTRTRPASPLSCQPPSAKSRSNGPLAGSSVMPRFSRGYRWQRAARLFVGYSGERAGRCGFVLVHARVADAPMLADLLVDPPAVRFPRGLLAGAERGSDLGPGGARGPRGPHRELTAVACLTADHLAEREQFQRLLPGESAGPGGGLAGHVRCRCCQDVAGPETVIPCGRRYEGVLRFNAVRCRHALPFRVRIALRQAILTILGRDVSLVLVAEGQGG